MKNTFYLLFALPVLFGCENPELKALEEKSKEAKCKVDFLKDHFDNSMNTIILGEKLGFKDEIESFNALKSDSLCSCDSLTQTWSDLSDRIYQASK